MANRQEQMDLVHQRQVMRAALGASVWAGIQPQVQNYLTRQLIDYAGGQARRGAGEITRYAREVWQNYRDRAQEPPSSLGRRNQQGERVGEQIMERDDQVQRREPKKLKRPSDPKRPPNVRPVDGSTNYNLFSRRNMPKRRSYRKGGYRKRYNPRPQRSLMVKPDGLYKERVKFIKDVLFRLDGAGGASCYLNIHHSRVYPTYIGPTGVNNCFVDSDNAQFGQVARIFQKYAIYGVSVRLIQKEFFPENSSSANVRGIASGTVPDYDPGSQNPSNQCLLTAQPAERLQNQTDFRYFVPRDGVSRYYKVGKWNKSTAGQYWYDCVNYNGASTPQTASTITTPTPEMSRVTCFTWDLSDQGWGNQPGSTFAAKAEVTYYVSFKDRRWSLQ